MADAISKQREQAWTEKSLKSLIGKSCEFTFKDPTGRRMTGLQARPTKSSLSLRYQYKLDGRRRIMTLGTYPEVQLKDLRRAYSEARAKVLLKIDPQAERDEAVARERQRRLEQEQDRIRLEGRLTMNYYSEFFLRDYKGRKGRPSPRTMKEYTLHVENVIKPSWGRFFLDDLPVQKIMADLREIATTRPVQANRVHATLSAMCTWAIKCDDIAVNPFLGKTKPGEENRKQRALDFDMELREPVNSGEIKTVWNAFESIDRKYKFAIRMILLTGQRPGEVLSARWDHFVNGRWIIPDTKNKNGLHKLPITPMLQLLLDDLKGTSGKSDWLFPDGTTLRPLVSNQLAKIVRYEIANGSLIGMAPWTPHVLRHTVATHLGYIGFYDDEIGVLLNHSRPGITARYNHSDGLSRMGCMLESWQRRLVDILDGKRGDNVVRMR